MENFSNQEFFSSTLYIVPTPIGNLNDITWRALFILRKVDLIAAEDTRRTSILLNYFSIQTPLFSFHEFNEKQKTSMLLSKLQLGNSIALVSDSGTPLISDPGYYFVCSCYDFGIRVVPLPGACAAITALSASGLPTNRFCFEGFVPIKRRARINYFRTLLYETRTLIFYDSKYRVFDTIEDMVKILGTERRVVFIRELTKIWEFIYRASLQDLLIWIKKNTECIRGEIILIVEGYHVEKNELCPEIRCMIQLLAKELPFRKIVNLIMEVYKINKNVVYRFLLKEKMFKK